MSQTLVAIAGEYDALDAMLAETDGELTPEIEAELAALDMKFAEKCERVALYILSRQRRAEAIKAEEARLAARRKADENGAANLKGYLERILRETNKERIDGVLVTVAFQKNNPSVVAPAWDQEALRGLAMVYPAFVTVIPEQYSLHKRAILEAAKADQPIPDGVAIVRSETLRIR